MSQGQSQSSQTSTAGIPSSSSPSHSPSLDTISTHQEFLAPPSSSITQPSSSPPTHSSSHISAHSSQPPTSAFSPRSFPMNPSSPPSSSPSPSPPPSSSPSLSFSDVLSTFSSSSPLLQNNYFGWRVYGVVPTSPCSFLSLIPYMDVITHINGVRLQRDEEHLFSLIKEEIPMELSIFSLSTRLMRKLSVVPNRRWGQGTSGMLGLLIGFDDFEYSDYESLHVLSVSPHSPASLSGMIPMEDFLLGTEKIAFRDWAHLDSFIETAMDKTQNVMVFNEKHYNIRMIQLTPSFNWGNPTDSPSALGAKFAVGIKHKIPFRYDNLGNPMEVKFVENYNYNSGDINHNNTHNHTINNVNQQQQQQHQHPQHHPPPHPHTQQTQSLPPPSSSSSSSPSPIVNPNVLNKSNVPYTNSYPSSSTSYSSPSPISSAPTQTPTNANVFVSSQPPSHHTQTQQQSLPNDPSLNYTKSYSPPSSSATFPFPRGIPSSMPTSASALTSISYPAPSNPNPNSNPQSQNVFIPPANPSNGIHQHPNAQYQQQTQHYTHAQHQAQSQTQSQYAPNTSSIPNKSQVSASSPAASSHDFT